MRTGQHGQSTVADYRAMPDDWRGELIEGRLVVAASPSYSHQSLVVALVIRLGEFLGRSGRQRLLVAPYDLVLGETNVLQPDVLVLPSGPPPAARASPLSIPVWVAEVLSPTTESIDREVKLPVYRRAGIPEAWLVDPARRVVEVHDLERGSRCVRAGREIARSRGLPGFELPVGEFFGPPVTPS